MQGAGPLSSKARRAKPPKYQDNWICADSHCLQAQCLFFPSAAAQKILTAWDRYFPRERKKVEFGLCHSGAGLPSASHAEGGVRPPDPRFSTLACRHAEDQALRAEHSLTHTQTHRDNSQYLSTERAPMHNPPQMPQGAEHFPAPLAQPTTYLTA